MEGRVLRMHGLVPAYSTQGVGTTFALPPSRRGHPPIVGFARSGEGGFNVAAGRGGATRRSTGVADLVQARLTGAARLTKQHQRLLGVFFRFPARLNSDGRGAQAHDLVVERCELLDEEFRE
jgi:hypothetical protein